MFKTLFISSLLSVFCVVSCCFAQHTEHTGNWTGTLPEKDSFQFSVSVSDLGSNRYRLVIANTNILSDRILTSSGTDNIELLSSDGLYLNLHKNETNAALEGFIRSGRLIFGITLQNVIERTYEGTWNPFMFNDGLISDDIMLYYEETDDSGFVAYPSFGDHRFRGAWASGFIRKDNMLFFTDDNTGFNFRATVPGDRISLEILLGDALITSTELVYSGEEWNPTTDPVAIHQNTGTPSRLDDEWPVANITDVSIREDELLRLISDVHTGELVNTHSVLIARRGQLVFETYFNGFNAHIPHDLRSASKSISSAVIGTAIDDGIIKNVDQKLYDFLPESFDYTRDHLKSEITLDHLLTMSSGLDVNGLASEGYYQSTDNTKSWLTAVLEAPMIHEAGTYTDYGSANPFLLGIVLHEQLELPLETYMHENLFSPLGIRNYVVQTDDTNEIPYFGGGMFMTPRDMLKFGQLYLDKGTWNGKRVLSEQWVEESFKKRVQLQDTRDKNEYGYQWWHDTYRVNGKGIDAIEARGAGGQFIFVIPELETVVAITSGNFRNRKGNQPRDILEKYILPAIE
ncbi:MAG: serine hydrolase [Bacteroidota bacterium]